MTRLSILVFLSLVAVKPVSGQASRCTGSLILEDRVGIVRLGMPIDSVRLLCGIVRDTSEESEGEERRVIYAPVGGDTLKIYVDRDAVWTISVSRPGFMTRDALHVGTPLRRFLVGRHPEVGVGEGKVFVFDSTHPGISFGLSSEAYARVPKLTRAGLARLPRSTIIDEILVRGIPRPPPDDAEADTRHAAAS